MADELTLLEIEQKLERAATKPLKNIFATILKELDVLWPGDDASPLEKQLVIRRLHLERFGQAAEEVIGWLLEGAASATADGFESGLEGARRSGVDVRDSFKRLVRPSTVRAIENVTDIIDEQVRTAEVALRTATTQQEVTEAVTIAGQSVTRVAATARWVANKSANDALMAVTERNADLISVLQPERDACVKCLEKAGHINTGHGDTVELPLHPNCRCRWRILEIETGKSVADAIKREAQRSILRGWSLPSESNSVRIKAAQKLLAKGSTLPKSVKDYARTAVRRGEFPKGRDFPGVR